MSYYKPGLWNVICQVCGRQFKADEIRKRWDGLLVCTHDYESRHSLDFIRVPQEHSVVPFTSPEPTDTFIYVCQYPNTIALADVGVADCSLVGFHLLPTHHERTPPIAGIAVAGVTYPAKDNPYD